MGLEIVRPDIPPDIEEILDEIRKVAIDPMDVDDEDAGIKYQWQTGLIEREDLLEILDGKRKFRKIYDAGLFNP